MAKTLDMKFIRYINLFNKIVKVKTNHCFEYNNTIIFVVPRRYLKKVLSPQNKNLQKLREIIGKKVKIIPVPKGIEDIENFISSLTYPLKIRGVEIKKDEITIIANPKIKASLIGRNKVRINEMEKILNQYFKIRKIHIK